MKSLFYKFALQSEYDALRVKDELTLYIITDTKRLYVGNKLYTFQETPSNLSDLSNYATKDYVDNAINNIQPSNMNLSNYATKNYVDNASFIPQLSPLNNSNNNKIVVFSDGGETVSASNKTIQEITNDIETNASAISTITTVNLPEKISKKSSVASGTLTNFTSDGDIESSNITTAAVNTAINATNYLMILTQNEYDSLASKIANHIYFTSDTNKIYVGENELNNTTNSQSINNNLFNSELRIGGLDDTYGTYVNMSNRLQPIDFTCINAGTYKFMATKSQYAISNQPLRICVYCYSSNERYIGVYDPVDWSYFPFIVTLPAGKFKFSLSYENNANMQPNHIKNVVVTQQTVYPKASLTKDGLMSKQHFNKLENQVLTVSDLVICSEDTYNNLSSKTASLYIVLKQSTVDNTKYYNLMDNQGNVLKQKVLTS